MVCYILESSRLVLGVAALTGRVAGVRAKWLDYRLLDVRDERGLLLRERIRWQDMDEIMALVVETPEYRESLRAEGSSGTRLGFYLSRVLASDGVLRRDVISRSALVIQLAAWKVRQEGGTPGVPLLYMERRPWLEVLMRYAARHGVEVIPVPASFSLRSFLLGSLNPRQAHILKWLLDHLPAWVPGSLGHGLPRPVFRAPDRPFSTGPLPARLGIEFGGQLNLEDPRLHSDLFFMFPSDLKKEDMVVTFAFPKAPFDVERERELNQKGIRAAVLQSNVRSVTRAPASISRVQGLERRWLAERIHNYKLQGDAWKRLFEEENIRLFVTWFIYDEIHCIIRDAVRECGGLLATYQRAYEDHASPQTGVSTDIFFGYSNASVEGDARAYSEIEYFVTTGYLGDFRFPLLREEARAVRARLHQSGATRILAYLDENSTGNERWHYGHGMTRNNYAFLLEKVLTDSHLGLVIKPKATSTLRNRLGPVADLLDRAKATGRCYVFEKGGRHGAYPPCAAALAADVCVHGHLLAGTAGIESALTGVPTLLLDSEGWPVSPLYQLGVGRVVFKDMESLWKRCVDHWNVPGGVPGLGDWGSYLDRFDPFRDGRAAERMGTYLYWVLEGLRLGSARETVLADAAERYAAVWGRDKIICRGEARRTGLREAVVP
ncbi:MAG: hypothetical protein HYY14_00500 [Candidatus Omnitrophica bacterium]|nr:hypothetical protein [Candidatus Omnitrophota bacterium]